MATEATSWELVFRGVTIANVFLSLGIGFFGVYLPQKRWKIDQTNKKEDELAERAEKKAAESRQRVENIINRFTANFDREHPMRSLVEAGLANIQTDDEARDVFTRMVNSGVAPWSQLQEYDWMAKHPEPLKIVEQLCANGWEFYIVIRGQFAPK